MIRLVLALYLLTLPQLYAQDFQGNQKDIDLILKSKADFSKHFVNGDYDLVAKRYTTDAKLFPNKMEIVQGADQIATFWKLPETITYLSHKITPSEIKIVDDHAYAYGHYTGTWQNEAGTESKANGKYVNVWRKEAGQWKVYLEIWNSIEK